MNDNFDFKIIGGERSPFLGYISARDKTITSARALIRGSVNVYKKISGTIASRPGLKRRGSADTTLAGIVASYTWETSLGRTTPLRVANNKLQVESDIVTPGTYVWYDLLVTSTLLNVAASLTRLVFDAWWDDTEKKDRLLIARGDTNLLHWSGGIAVIGTVDVSGATIQLLDTTKTWAQMGIATNTAAEKKLIINSLEFTYTGGETTNTLTGVTGTLASLSSGQVAIQSVCAEASTPASGYTLDFLKVLNNQVLTGSYTSRILYLSENTHFNNFTNTGALVYGDPDFAVLDDCPTGIAIKSGAFRVSAGLSDWYTITPNSVPPISFSIGSSTHFIITKVEKHPGSGLTAAYAHEFIDTVGDDIVFLGKDQQLRIFGTFRNLTHPKFPSLSQAVQDELKNEDFSGGHLKAIGEFIHITAPNNGRDWMYQVRERVDDNGNVVAERLWHPPQVRNVSRFESIDGVTYGHSNSHPQIYQVWDTHQWTDDSPTDEDIPYTAKARWGYQNNLGRRQGMSKFDKLFVEGYMSPGVELKGNVFHDYQGASGIAAIIINSLATPAKFFTGNSPSSMGGSSMGDNPLGDGVVEDPDEQELLPKFKAIRKITEVNEFEFTYEVYSEGADARWEILATGANIVKATQQATFISKSG